MSLIRILQRLRVGTCMSRKLLWHYHVFLDFFFQIILFFVLRPPREYFPHMDFLFVWSFLVPLENFSLKYILFEGDVPNTAEGLHTFGWCSTFKTFEQGANFIVTDLLWHGASVFKISSEWSQLHHLLGKQMALKTFSNPDHDEIFFKMRILLVSVWDFNNTLAHAFEHATQLSKNNYTMYQYPFGL